MYTFRYPVVQRVLYRDRASGRRRECLRSVGYDVYVFVQNNAVEQSLVLSMEYICHWHLKLNNISNYYTTRHLITALCLVCCPLPTFAPKIGACGHGCVHKPLSVMVPGLLFDIYRTGMVALSVFSNFHSWEGERSWHFCITARGGFDAWKRGEIMKNCGGAGAQRASPNDVGSKGQP